MLVDLPDLYHVIRYQTMSSADQFQRCLTLSNTALTCNENTFTVNIDQYAVDRNARSQFFAQCVDQFCHKFRSGTSRSKYRNPIFLCDAQKLLIRLQITAEDHTRDLIFQKLIVDINFFVML